MRNKLLFLALAGCLELFASAAPAQAQVFLGFGGRGWRVGVGLPVGPGYGYYGPRYYGYPGYYYGGYPYYYGGAVVPAVGVGVAAAPAPVYGAYYPPPAGGAVLATQPPPPAGPPAAPTPSSVPSAPAPSTNQMQTLPAPQGLASDRINFRVTVPAADAQVWVNDRPLQPQGAERSFVSPSLQPGTYTYRVKATWTENGREVVQQQQIEVHPGQSVTVGFGQPR